jgi:hypothetical protein
LTFLVVSILITCATHRYFRDFINLMISSFLIKVSNLERHLVSLY